MSDLILQSPYPAGGGGSAPADGDIVLLLSADVEPTGGGTPRWWTTVSGTAPSTSASPTDVHSRAWIDARVGIDLPVSTLTPSLRIRIYVTTDVTGLIARFFDSGTGEHLEVAYIAGGNFRVSTNVTTHHAISTGGHITLNNQFYIELVGVVHATNGSFTCKLYNNSGTLLETLSASGIDTQDGATSVQAVALGGFTGAIEDIDFDAEGQAYGPCQVELTPPNGPGDLTQLSRTGTDSGANWSQVDEVPLLTTAVDAVISTGADQYDCYAFPAGSVSGTVIAAGVSAACIAASGTVNFNFVCRIAGVTYEHPTTHTMTTSAKMFGAYWRNNPATNAPWGAAERDAAQWGCHIHATNGAIRGLYRASLIQL